MTFLRDTYDFFTGQRTAHMGPYQYAAHGGMRGGKSTSGALLWAEAEAARQLHASYLGGSEARLLRKAAEEIRDHLPEGLPVVDLGPGTVNAFENKTLPILQSLRSKAYIPVDESMAFLQGVTGAAAILSNLKIKPVIDDFFDGEHGYCDEAALICSFGSTISNIVSPISEQLPEADLTHSLSQLAAAVKEGWLLIAFDSDHDGDKVKDYYSEHGLFQINIFDRMAVELPVQNFDPLAFDYEPLWIAASGQLAHMAVVNRDLKFKLDKTEISLVKGQKLHIKNSYKFTPAFFERCCKMAGFEVVRTWADKSPVKAYLLKLPQFRTAKIQDQPMRLAAVG